MLQPLCHPARGTGDGKHGGEHAGRNVQGLVDDAGVEIHVRIQFAFDKIVIFERDFLQLHGQIEQRIGDTEIIQHVMAGLTNDFCARIEILVNTMAKAHQSEWIILVFGFVDVLADMFDAADLAEHGQYSFIGATMRRPPQCRNTC